LKKAIVDVVHIHLGAHVVGGGFAEDLRTILAVRLESVADILAQLGLVDSHLSALVVVIVSTIIVLVEADIILLEH
jgi:hypothetical protein